MVYFFLYPTGQDGLTPVTVLDTFPLTQVMDAFLTDSVNEVGEGLGEELPLVVTKGGRERLFDAFRTMVGEL